MRYFLAALLNLIPGFGLGYLAVGERRKFRRSLLVWLIPGAVAGVSLWLFLLCIRGGGEDVMICVIFWPPIIIGLAIGVLAVNVPGAVDLLSMSREREPPSRPRLSLNVPALGCIGVVLVVAILALVWFFGPGLSLLAILSVGAFLLLRAKMRKRFR